MSRTRNVNFGQVQTPSNTYDPASWAAGGFARATPGQRLGAAGSAPPCLGGGGLQPPVVPGVHVDRQPGGDAGRLRSFSITAPPDPRLPGGGNYVISDLTNISNAAFGKTDNFITLSRNFGDSTNYWHGVDMNINARTANGMSCRAGRARGAG